LSLETPIGDKEDSRLGDFIEDKNAIPPGSLDLPANFTQRLSLPRPSGGGGQHLDPRFWNRES
jgi:hypothetical protein